MVDKEKYQDDLYKLQVRNADVSEFIELYNTHFGENPKNNVVIDYLHSTQAISDGYDDFDNSYC